LNAKPGVIKKTRLAQIIIKAILPASISKTPFIF
jgi:hypothetical protein